MTDKVRQARGQEAAILRETLLVAWVGLGLALVSLAYCVRHGFLLLYGDAVAHLHIARRVFDSLDPSYRNLGSVWLPLPHLLLVPFVLNSAWWRSGLAGAWISIPAYVLGCAGLYRLGRMWLPVSAAVVVAAFYALNPGLLYMATTAMTEPLFLAEIIWAVLLIVRYERELEAESEAAIEGRQQGTKPQSRSSAGNFLISAGLVLAAAIFTRYDGWIFAAAAWIFATRPLLLARRWKQPVAGAWVLFTALLIAAPATWIAYNAKQFGDPLDFIRGPYSARAIEARTTPPGAPPHPGFHNTHIASLYFVKAAEMGAAPLWLGGPFFWLCIAGTLLAIFFFRQRQIGPALLFWLPLPFYTYSIAYASTPVFIPIWGPNSWYNTRYGMELLPAFALFAGSLAAALILLRPKLQAWIFAVCLTLVVLNSLWLLRSRPLVFEEAVVNARTRLPFEHALANALFALPDRGLILMGVSRAVGAVQQTEIPLRRFICDEDYPQWQNALLAPAKAVPIVIALDGDAVSEAVAKHPQGLRLTDVICSTGQPCARIYRSQLYAAGPMP